MEKFLELEIVLSLFRRVLHSHGYWVGNRFWIYLGVVFFLGEFLKEFTSEERFCSN